ncbi:MAG: FAD/FMN-containing dehydrogenase [Candidatus Azotimanducaceae bacterium]|jgi:FAD/FMN-containing dehydrogenase
MSVDWENWSGSQKHQAAPVELPKSEDELGLLINSASKKQHTVRAIGSAHSFVPFWTDDTLVSLDEMKGLVSIDHEKRQATVRAGTKLHELGPILWENELALENMGDIDRQSLAGAISTGTHGTGRTLGNISSQVQGLRIVDASGNFHDLDETHGDLLNAAQISLGTMGIISQITIQLLPAYYLHEKNWALSVDACAEELEALIFNNRHLEFFWDPVGDQCLMKSLNVSENREERRISEHEEIGKSHEIFPSNRDFRFNEIEFCLSADRGWACFLEIRDLMKSRYPEVRWPLEYRTLKADKALLSSTAQEDCVTISAHEGYKQEYKTFFLDVEKIFRRFGARPHWGKIHSHERNDLDRIMPKFERFREIRREFDPDGRFLNHFLEKIFL